MAQLIDHLWQSALCVALIGLLSWLTRRNSAALRLWLWRLAALKFLLPFSLLFALGGWLGFPVRHSAIPPPAPVVKIVDALLPMAAPAQSFAPSNYLLVAGVVLGLLITGACGLWIYRKLRESQRQNAEELARASADPLFEPAPLVFLNATALAGSVLCLVATPIIAGAEQDRLRRQEALGIDIIALRSAAIVLSETPSRFGARPEILASGAGVVIRQTNLQDLVAMVYGIDEFEVFGGALPWLESPHYNVQIDGPVHEPAVFDAYALRQPVTDYLYHEYGVSIRVNGSCQEPCTNQQSFTIERLR